MTTELILNLGAGNTKPFLSNDNISILVNVDTGYKDHQVNRISDIHNNLMDYINVENDVEFFTNEDAFEFLSTQIVKFDKVVASRFLEHIPHEKVPYILYLIGNVLKKDGEFEFIVPDYLKLSKLLIANDNPSKPSFHNVTTLLTYEMLADPYCPHCSLWTKNRAEALLTAENIFEVDEIVEDYEAFGRDIYLHVTAHKAW